MNWHVITIILVVVVLGVGLYFILGPSTAPALPIAAGGVTVANSLGSTPVVNTPAQQSNMTSAAPGITAPSTTKTYTGF